jgi:hypothetical protein
MPTTPHNLNAIVLRTVFARILQKVSIHWWTLTPEYVNALAELYELSRRHPRVGALRRECFVPT